MTERNIEREFITLGQHLGMGTMVWSPLASGLLSGKYKPSQGGFSGEGRLDATRDVDNPAFKKISEKNWKIVLELETVAKEVGHSFSQVY